MKRKVAVETEGSHSGADVTDDIDGPKQKNKKSESTEIASKEERERFKHSLYRPPTSEELNELKETENLYKNNLFRLQISYLLEEVKAANKKSKSLEKFLHCLNDFFANLESSERHDLSDLSWLPKDIKYPLSELPQKQTKGKFSFTKPSTIKVIGSYLLKTVTKPSYNVDLAVEIPKECFQDKDHINYRYHTKRAIYLTILASRLKNWDAVETVQFSRVENNPHKPILVIKPAGKAGSRYVIKIHPIIAENVFKLPRFGPLRSNVRSNWFEGKDDASQELAHPTPKYNNSILTDILLEKHLGLLYDAMNECEKMADAAVLFKVWLHQRFFSEGESCFNGFQMSMLMAYLLQTKKITSQMSSYQIFRITLHYISKSDWTTKGISMANADNNNSQPSMEDFHSAFDVVFIDSSGYLNLCANMRKTTYEMLKYEAGLAIQFLEDSTIDGFEALFMKPCKFYEVHDQWFSIQDLQSLEKITKNKTLQGQLIDHGGDWLPVAIDWIIQKLSKGLGKRIDAIDVKRQRISKWNVDCCPPTSSISEITIGLLLNNEHAESILDMGPSANDPQAAEFRSFWGEKSDLRRFQDGSINEAVVWEANSKGEKRWICKQVIEFLLHKYCNLEASAITYHADQFDCLIQPKYNIDPASSEKKQKETKALESCSGEEDLLSVIYVFDELCRQIKNLDDLPLEVNNIQGIHPVFRMTEVFPPRPSLSQSKEGKKIFESPSIEKHSKFCPAIEVVLQFEGSGKWPDDIQAIQYMKAAFYLKLSSLLKTNCALVTLPGSDHLDVLKKGFVFRIRIFHYREMILYQQSAETGNLKKEHESKAHKLNIEMVKRPLHSTMIYSVHQRYPVYGLTTRLAKRWISSQMLGDYLSDEAIELLVASLFVTAAPYRPPSSQMNGFLRFLTLMSDHDWQANPVIVDLNQSLKADDHVSTRESFSANRQQLPSVFIAAPYDKEKSIWTKGITTPQILRRLVTLAKASRDVLEAEMGNLNEESIKRIFRPPLDDYDVLINLDSCQLPRHYQAVDSTVRLRQPKQKSLHQTSMPVVQFDPVQLYLTELRAAFSEIALFFYDKFGSTVIGVVWKPTAFTPQPFKILGSKYKVPLLNRTTKKIEASSQPFMVPNTAAILSDFQILGRGLVTGVESLKLC